jgi:ESS family glutamate:Na+ symporter
MPYLPVSIRILVEAVETPAVALVALGLVLVVGRRLGHVLGLRHWGIPEALLAGVLGLLVAPAGLVPLLSQPVIEIWEQLPMVLLTLVFGTLLLAKPLPRLAGLWRPLSAQVLLALTLAFGQYMVGGLVVLLVLQPWLGVHPLMACLIEVAYEGGHGSAAAMGASYASLGFEGGEALGLAMATVGLLISTVVGGLVVLLARSRGWLMGGSTIASGVAPLPEAEPGASSDQGDAAPAQAMLPLPPPPELRFSALALNLALTGIAVAIGVVALAALRLVSDHVGGGLALVVDVFPVFPLALVGSLLVRWLLERFGKDHWVSTRVQNRLATVSADLLIAAATACLDLSLLAHDWKSLTTLAVAGLAWNLGVVLLLGPRILPSAWFERGILEFGQATGVAASGLLLLRMADPLDQSEALQPFSIKQLLLQPFVAGGLITVVAPLAVSNWGLPAWTGLCLVLVLIWVGLGLGLMAGSRSAS